MNNMKKSTKVIVTTAVLAAVACGTVILANEFAADKNTRELPALSQQAHGSGNDDVLTKGGIAQGSDSAVRQATGTESDSQAADTKSGDQAAPPPADSAAPVTQGATAVVDASGTAIELLPAAATDQKQDEQAVRTLVEGFGKKLQMVSLLAPKETAAKSMQENYSDYVTPELLQKWMADPQNAPGRLGSSPWPDHIGILNIEPGNNDQYIVNGELFEVTSVELAYGGAAAKRPVTMTVRKTDGRWLISSVTLGEYAKRGPVKYENKQYGFEFYLPEDWKGYSIIEEKWEGRSGADLVETGPQILIRNPAWTKKNPYQDIPIMVITIKQWNALQSEKFFVSAAPIGPSVLGSNSEYIFALPPRYNYAFPTGYEEVEKIMSGSPLWPIDSGMNC